MRRFQEAITGWNYLKLAVSSARSILLPHEDVRLDEARFLYCVTDAKIKRKDFYFHTHSHTYIHTNAGFNFILHIKLTTGLSPSLLDLQGDEEECKHDDSARESTASAARRTRAVSKAGVQTMRRSCTDCENPSL